MPELNFDKLFRSTEELTEPEQSLITGRVPDWLHGTFIRAGPGKFDLPNFSMNHWLDGYCILSKFEIHGGDGGSVTFHKKFLDSDVYKKANRVQKPVLCEFGTRGYPDPSKSIFSRLISSVIPIELSDNDQLSLFQLGNETFTTSETNYFRGFDLETLETGEKLDTNRLFGTNICSAHPLTDAATGITYNFGATCLTGLKYHVVKIPGLRSQPTASSAKDLMKKSKILCSIPSSWIGMMSYFHSFGMTANYLIFIEQPYVMNITKAVYSVIKGRGGYCFRDWLDWRPEYKNRFLVIEKETGKLLKIEFITEHAFFFLHFINCYEDNNQIVVDLSAYPSPTFLEDGMLLAKLREPCMRGEDCHEYAFASAQRFVLPLISTDDLARVPEGRNLVEIKSEARAARNKTNQIILNPEILTKPGLEFPRINPHMAGKKYACFYAAGSTTCGYFQNSICKMNCKSKQMSVWKAGSNYFPGEPIFLPAHHPNPSNTSSTITRERDYNNNNYDYDYAYEDCCGDEDDGVIISAVSDVKYNANDFLLFLDARTMTELGRAHFKAHVPQAIHGLFVPDGVDRI